MCISTKHFRKASLILAVVFTFAIVFLPAASIVYGVGSPTISLSPNILRDGETTVVTAKNFPPNAELHSVIIWGKYSEEYGMEIGDFPNQITVDNVVYSYNDTIYKYENNGVTVKTNSSGELTFSVQIPMDLNPGNNYIAIWTDGFTPGTEAEAQAFFTLDLSGTTPPPSISAISPAEASAGETVDIKGTNFGSIQGEVILKTDNGEEAIKAKSWSDSSISFTIPEGTSAGNASVSVSNAETYLTSSPKTITITAEDKPQVPRLSFINQVGSVYASPDIRLGSAILVSVVDQNGNVMIDNTDTIQLIAVNPSLPILMLQNKAFTVKAENGVASFTSLYLPFVGEGYTLVAKNISDSSMEQAVSDVFNVKAPEDYNGEIKVVVSPESGAVPGLDGSTLKIWNGMAVSGAASTISGAGNYNFKNLKAASGYTVSIISQDGNTLAQATNIVLESNKVTTVTLVPKPLSSLNVTVNNAEGKAVSSAWVTITEKSSKELVAAHSTDANGKIPAVEGVVQGKTYVINAEPASDMPYEKSGVSKEYTVAVSGNNAVLTLKSLDAGTVTISGKVTLEDQKPAEGITVSAFVEADGRPWSFTAVTGSDGSYSIKNVYSGNITMSAAKIGYGSEEITEKAADYAVIKKDFVVKPIVRLISAKIQIRKKYAGEDWQQPYTPDYMEAIRNNLRIVGSNQEYAPVYTTGTEFMFYGIFDSEKLTVKMDAKEDRLIDSKEMEVTYDGNTVIATFDLEAIGEVRGNLIDAVTEKSINLWSGAIYKLEDGRESWIRDITASSSDFMLAVPELGTYILRIDAYNVTTEKSFTISKKGQAVDLGKVKHNTKGRFEGQPGNGVDIIEAVAVPGGEINVKVNYKNSGDPTKDTEVVLNIPVGAEIVHSSVALNSKPVFDLIESTSAYIVKLGSLAKGEEGTISYKLRLRENYRKAAIAASVKINYKDEKSTKTTAELLGTAKIDVIQIHLQSSRTTNKLDIVISGQAPPNKDIKIYAEGTYLLGTVNSKGGGYFKLPVALPEISDKYTYTITAVSESEEETLRSNVSKVNYDKNAAVITNISILYSGIGGKEKNYSFDPRQGQPMDFITIIPGPITVEVTFDKSEKVHEVNVMIQGLGKSAAVRREDGIFNATLHVDNMMNIPGDLYVGYSLRNLFTEFYSKDGKSIAVKTPPSEVQVRNTVPAVMRDFEIVDSNVLTGKDADKLTGSVLFADESLKMDYDFTIEKNVGGYMPSATDRALAKMAGSPIFGDKIEVMNAADGSLMITRSFYYFNSLDDALKAMQDDPLPSKATITTVIDKVKGVVTDEKVVKGAENAVNLSIFAATNGKNGIDSWYNLDNASKIDELYQRISEARQKGNITQEQYDSLMERTNKAFETLVAGQVVSSGVDIGTSVPMPLPATLLTAAVNYEANMVWDKYRDSEINQILLDLESMENKKTTGDILDELEKARQELERQKEKYKGVHDMLDPYVDAYKTSGKWIVDPSGYVYEGLPENRLEGVTVTLMKLDPNTKEWKKWDAENYGQKNPLKTDAKGYYAWDVPQGDYMVVYQLEGYKLAKYHVGTVPPPRFDVNMGLISEKGASIEAVTAETSGAFIEIAFDQYVQAASFYGSSEYIEIYDSSNKKVPGTIITVNPVVDENGMPLVKAVRFIPNTALKQGAKYSVKVSKDIKNYGNIVMNFTAATQSKDVTVPAKAPVPVITSIKQAQGSIKEGAQLIIIGSGFIGAKSVKFGNTEAVSLHVDSDRQIRVMIPAGSGTKGITVVTTGGTSKAYNIEYQSNESNEVKFITAVSPDRGHANGGTTVKITGKGFTGVTAVKFGSMSVQSFKVVSDTEIMAVTPMGIGTVPVTITTPLGDILVSNASFKYLESHIIPVGTTGGKLSTLDNKNSFTIPEGAFKVWQIATMDEVDADALTSLPTGYKVISRALKIDFGAGVVPELAVTLKLGFKASDIAKGQQALIHKIGDAQPLKTTIIGEQASAEINAAGTYVVVIAKGSFEDLGNHSWAKEQIETLASMGVIDYRDGNFFYPARSITRAEYLGWLVRALELKADFTSNFDDVSPDEYYYKEIGIAKALGVTGGVGDNKYNPNGKITRQDMSALTQRALRNLGIITGTYSTEVLNSFKDTANISDYAVESMAVMVGEGILRGSDGNLNPRSETSKAEAAVIVYRIYNLLAIK